MHKKRKTACGRSDIYDVFIVQQTMDMNKQTVATAAVHNNERRVLHYGYSGSGVAHAGLCLGCLDLMKLNIFL